MKEARRSLPQTSRRFREKGAEAEPVVFGPHRKPSGVMLSYERYNKLLDLLDDFAAALEIRRRDRADTGERLTLEELITDQGFDPAEFGLKP
jgi:antitoxin StbD